MDKQLLRNIIYTLNSVEVKGKENLDRLLGCINALESVLKVEEIRQQKECEEIDNGG